MRSHGVVWRCVALLFATLCLLSPVAHGAEELLPRFFFSGNGMLAIENGHTDEKAAVAYRRADGTYDEGALAHIRYLFRSRTDDAQGPLSLRLVELLAYVQSALHPQRMILISGYRSPDFNASLSGAAESSLHTQGLAADVMLTGVDLKRAWLRLRQAHTGGVGYYATDKYLHIDVGQPRFWEKTTSRVGEKIAAGNARIFVRSDFDRNLTLEATQLHVYNVTAAPLRIAKQATLVGYPEAVVRLQPATNDEEGDCIVIRRAGEPSAIRIGSVERQPDTGTRRTRVLLSTCEPRLEQTPATIESNELEIGR